MKPFPIKGKLSLLVSKNHYNNYEEVDIDSVAELIKVLARYCVCPLTKLDDEEKIGKDGSSYLSKAHRANGNILSRAKLAIIDFEGSLSQYEKLLQKMKHKKIWFVSVPSQSNLSDKKNRRAHIVYLLKEPYSINKEAFKNQAKAFFKYIKYKWDETNSGIDAVATFNAAGYFSPTFQLPRDAKTKKIDTPYKNADMVKKDIDVNIGKNTKAYKPIKAISDEPNQKGISIEAKEDKKVSMREFNSCLLYKKENTKFVTSSLAIPVASGGYTSIETLEEDLRSIEGENPTISGLGCPECSKIHSSDPKKTRYSFAGLDDDSNIFIHCGGSHNVTYKPVNNPVTVYRKVKQSTGSSEYIIIDENLKIHYTDKSVGSVILNASSCADELNSKYEMGIFKDDNYNRGLTISAYVTDVPSIQLQYHPFKKSGLDAVNGIYNLIEAPKHIPTPEEPNEIVKLALGAFDNDTRWNNIPFGVICLAYYLFHDKKIMAMLFLVHSERKIGKSTWALDIPKWYLSRAWGIMDNQAISNAWDDAKLGVRCVCYEDIENQDNKVKKRLISDLKSDATAGEYKLLNIKGQEQVRSFGHNVIGTTNHRDQIPLDGQHDRRIHLVEFNPIYDKHLLGAFDISKSGENNLLNAVNYLYSVYQKCEDKMDDELYNYLYTETPYTKVKKETAASNLRVGEQIGNTLLNSKTKEELKVALQPLVSIDNDSRWLPSWIKNINLKRKGDLDITDKQLLELYQMTPNGGQFGKEYTSIGLIQILGLQDKYPKGFIQLKIKSKKFMGIKIEGYSN